MGPVLDAVARRTGRGYYMIASDGGVFTFGDAGSTARPGHALVPAGRRATRDPDGTGYWLVAADGGLFGFGVPFPGAIPGAGPGQSLNAPIIGAVGYGNAYLMVASDGGVFNFATTSTFQGSLGGETLASPIVGLVPANGTVVARATSAHRDVGEHERHRRGVVNAGWFPHLLAGQDGQQAATSTSTPTAAAGRPRPPGPWRTFWATGTRPRRGHRSTRTFSSACDDNAGATPVTVSIDGEGAPSNSSQVTPSVENHRDEFANAVLVTTFTVDVSLRAGPRGSAQPTRHAGWAGAPRDRRRRTTSPHRGAAMAQHVRAVVARSVKAPVTVERSRCPTRARARPWCGCRRAASATPTCTTARAASTTSSRSCSATRPPAWWRPSGDGVTDVAPGDYVILAWRAPCGTCRSCRRGRPWYCFDSPQRHAEDDPRRHRPVARPGHRGLRREDAGGRRASA